MFNDLKCCYLYLGIAP
uniref:Uncharacterized protein n=1 Tax=Rhizophora mucronata TaxID=61149 RepID=A0A2P2QCG2_RHIMU